MEAAECCSCADRRGLYMQVFDIYRCGRTGRSLLHATIWVTYCSIHGTDTPTHDGSCTHDVKRQRATCPDHLPGIITQQVSCSNTAPLGLNLDTHPHVIFIISDTH